MSKLYNPHKDLTTLYPYWKKLMLPALKVNAFSLISPYFLHVFHQQWKRHKIHRDLWIYTENFKPVKICQITFGILWMKSQFQPDFTDYFFTRDRHDRIVFLWILIIILTPCFDQHHFRANKISCCDGMKKMSKLDVKDFHWLLISCQCVPI